MFVPDLLPCHRPAMPVRIGLDEAERRKTLVKRINNSDHFGRVAARAKHGQCAYIAPVPRLDVDCLATTVNDCDESINGE